MTYVYSLSTHEKKNQYLTSLFNETYLKDVIEPNNIQNEKEILDWECCIFCVNSYFALMCKRFDNSKTQINRILTLKKSPNKGDFLIFFLTNYNFWCNFISSILRSFLRLWTSLWYCCFCCCVEALSNFWIACSKLVWLSAKINRFKLYSCLGLEIEFLCCLLCFLNFFM